MTKRIFVKRFFLTAINLLTISLFASIQLSASSPTSQTSPTQEDLKPDPLANENVSWSSESEWTPYEEYEIFKEAYPDVHFQFGYDREVEDWTLTVTAYGKKTVLYHAGGLYLPKKYLAEKSHYWRVIYNYQNQLADPADFTEEQKQRIIAYSSTENRQKGAVSSKFIFDAIHDCWTRASTESHLKSRTLWGRPTGIHADIVKPLDRVEERVYELAKTDPEVKAFLSQLLSCDAYNWREIRDSHTKSFHSFGIAIDVLPRGWGRKITYWGFEKQKGNEKWMLIPLKNRWMPPKPVIDAFEAEGFIWGGYWAIWDNMHFEYHPELIIAARRKAEKQAEELYKKQAEEKQNKRRNKKSAVK